MNTIIIFRLLPHTARRRPLIPPPPPPKPTTPQTKRVLRNSYLTSIANGGLWINVTFSIPFTVLQSGYAPNVKFYGDTTVSGQEGDCILQFTGTITEFSFTVCMSSTCVGCV